MNMLRIIDKTTGKQEDIMCTKIHIWVRNEGTDTDHNPDQKCMCGALSWKDRQLVSYCIPVEFNIKEDPITVYDQQMSFI